MKNNRKDSQENLKRNVQAFEDIPIELRIKEDELENDFKQERDNLRKLREIYSANPSDELSKEIERTEKRMWEKYGEFANFSTKIHGF